MLRAVIIEDSDTSRLCLENLLKEFCPDKLQVIATGESYASGLNVIRTKKPDVVFLDMELPGGTGLDILSSLGKEERNFAVIVTTDWTQYSLLALKEGVVDYLSKPIDIDELMSSVEKAWLNRQKESLYLSVHKNQLLVDFLSSQKTDNPQLILSSSRQHHSIDLIDIIYCESDHKYTEFHMKNNQIIRVRKNLSDYEEFLTMRGFIRINRSVIVNIVHITSDTMALAINDSISLTDNDTLSVSRQYRFALGHALSMIR